MKLYSDGDQEWRPNTVPISNVTVVVLFLSKPRRLYICNLLGGLCNIHLSYLLNYTYPHSR